MKFVGCLLLMTGLVVPLAWSAELESPADAKLRAVYQRCHFSQQYPPEAVEFIETQLRDAAHPVGTMAELAKDKRSEVRSLTAFLLGEYGDAAGAKILWSLTRDELESVRLTAAGALARLAHLTAFPVDTTGLTDERPTVRRLAASILGALGDHSAEDALLEALKDENELVRTDVVKALSRGSCGTLRALPSLIELLHDPSANVRDRTAYVLAGYQDPSVIEPLKDALKDSDWHVRASAAEALGRWIKRRPELIDVLVKVMEQDDFALVRDRTADALSVAGKDERVVAALVKVLTAEQRDVRFHAAQALILAKATSALPQLTELCHDTNTTADVREKIMDIFGRIGGPEQLPVIVEATSDPDPLVQLAAVNAMRRLKDRGGATQLLKLLQDSNPHVRAASARALGDMGAKDASLKILPLLRDQSGYVRGAAAEALGKLGDRTAIIPLIQVLGGEKQSDDSKAGLVIGTKSEFLADIELKEVQVKTRAVEALGVLRAPEAVEPIIQNGLKADDASLRAVSAYALGQIADRRAVEPLQEAVRSYYAEAPTDFEYVIDPGGNKVPDEARRIKEKESRVRASVAWALGQIGDPAAKQTLQKAMNDQNSLVRDAAAEALAKIEEKKENEDLAVFDKGAKPAPKAH